MPTDDTHNAREAKLDRHVSAAKAKALDPEILRQVHQHHRSGRPLVLMLMLDTDVPLVELLTNAAVAATAPGVTAVHVASLDTSGPTGPRDPSKRE